MIKQDQLMWVDGHEVAAHDDGPWPRMHPRERGCILRAAAQILRSRKESIGEVETHEDLVVPASGELMNYVRRVPLGVVGAITPWNHPLLITMKKVAPALAAGNTLVKKPSELAPVAPLELARALVEAGIPDGVINVVPGFGPDAGKALAGHRRIDRIDITGGMDAVASQRQLDRILRRRGRGRGARQRRRLWSLRGGVDAFNDYTAAQSVLVNLSRTPFDWFGSSGELRYS